MPAVHHLRPLVPAPAKMSPASSPSPMYHPYVKKAVSIKAEPAENTPLISSFQVDVPQASKPRMHPLPDGLSAEQAKKVMMNRMSQARFRQKRNAYLRELETKARQLDEAESVMNQLRESQDLLEKRVQEMEDFIMNLTGKSYTDIRGAPYPTTSTSVVPSVYAAVSRSQSPIWSSDSCSSDNEDTESCYAYAPPNSPTHNAATSSTNIANYQASLLAQIASLAPFENNTSSSSSTTSVNNTSSTSLDEIDWFHTVDNDSQFDVYNSNIIFPVEYVASA